MVQKAARRYANALITSAIEQDLLEEVKSDILLIEETLSNSSDLRLFLKSPIIKKEDKTSVVEQIFGDKIQKLTSGLLSILSQKGREKLLHDITVSFLELYNEHHNIKKVDVVTAFELSEDQLSNLQKELGKAIDKTVLMDVTEDQSLIGGLTVQIDDTIIDGSSRYKLNKLKNKFTSAVE